jgi:hypothetical protein
LAVALACAVGCGGGGDEEVGSPAAERDRQLLEETSLRKVRSGYFDATFFLDNETKAVAVQWGAEGPFIRSGGTLQAKARWEFAGLDGLKLGRLLVLGDRTILGSGGNSYRLPAPMSAPASQASSDCRRSLEDFDFTALVKNLNTKPEPVGETTVEGDLRLEPLLAALRRLTAPSVCGSLLRAAGMSPQALGALEAQVERTFKKSEASFTFDKDHVLTGLSLGIYVESPPPGQEEIDGILTVDLTRVNEVGELSGSPSTKTIDAQAPEASTVQRSRVEGWIGLVDAVLSSLASG